MANETVMTAPCSCSFGAAPAPLTVSSQSTVLVEKLLAGTIMDNTFPTFGLCSNPANPTVAAATTAALGVLTPMPCVPLTVAPWMPGSPTVLICGKPALGNSCKLMCGYGGVIQINQSVAQTVTVP